MCLLVMLSLTALPFVGNHAAMAGMQHASHVMKVSLGESASPSSIHSEHVNGDHSNRKADHHNHSTKKNSADKDHQSPTSDNDGMNCCMGFCGTIAAENYPAFARTVTRDCHDSTISAVLFTDDHAKIHRPPNA